LPRLCSLPDSQSGFDAGTGPGGTAGSTREPRACAISPYPRPCPYCLCWRGLCDLAQPLLIVPGGLVEVHAAKKISNDAVRRRPRHLRLTDAEVCEPMEC
jgi:hypothetical protein